jgi:hypothetical protein
MFRSTIIIRELQCPCQSHYYLTTVVCMLSVVVWQHIILFWIGLCLRSVPGVRVLARAVDDWLSSTALARTHILHVNS